MNTNTKYDFLQIDENQNLQLMKVLQKFASPNGVKIYVKQCSPEYDDEITQKKYMNPSASTELEAARKLLFIENMNLHSSYNREKESDGAISIEHLGYTISVSVAGCRTNCENVFVEMLFMSFLTNLTLGTISAILGSKFDLENFGKELSVYEN